MTTIYHYCDANAFMSIIRNDALWLTSIAKMNDITEGKLLRKKIKAMLDEEHKSGKINDEFYNFQCAMLSSRLTDSYACSFSEEGDSTVQWMTYGDSGRGYAIGFDIERLKHHISEILKSTAARTPEHQPFPEMTLCQVEYIDDNEQLLDEKIKEMQAAENDAERYMKLTFALCFDTARWKHHGFRQEKEWRAVYSTMYDSSEKDGLAKLEPNGSLKELLWRNNVKRGMIPYFEMHGIKSCINAICVGPGINDESTIETTQLFLATHGLIKLPVIGSKSPYQ